MKYVLTFGALVLLIGCVDSHSYDNVNDINGTPLNKYIDGNVTCYWRPGRDTLTCVVNK